MKKIFILLAASVVTLAANAQNITQVSKKEMKHEKHQEKKNERKELRKLEGTEASYQSKEAFLEAFPNATDVNWSRDKFYDIASFNLNGIHQTAYYDYKSELVGTVIPKTFSDLPASAQKWIDKKYAGYEKGRVILFDDNEYNETDMMLYGLQFQDEDNYFIELQKGTSDIVLQVTPEGNVFYFTEVK
ncbi:hypothetical protein [Pseudobacter ginsenosidimutans]|uniref:PepSY-like beta-lactamase-inhibitor n=1 Tax=Pseudobacter ginsenosidimutans TaxID=661488 RepID=A0A4Q7MR91_9BACT|nr:hypothetical protein [Pseudobacter ginsenosidimutans]QEC45775.1 hypothetical protein FSB84_30305 [Pseudobacter ginsenosidimutans]RZS69279.1 hypothetical protein EV199_5115 [Pseudobacter ginsenosidimutans]